MRVVIAMATPFENTYDLSENQLADLERAEEMMLKNDLGNAEDLLLKMLAVLREYMMMRDWKESLPQEN